MGIEIKDDKILGQIYEDILQPTTQQIGGILEDTIKTARLLLAPLSLCGVGADRLQNWCDRIRTNVKNENMQSPNPNILIPTINGLSINPDDTLLGEMFFNILQSSVDKTRQEFLNPAFTEILKQLSKDEAIIILLFKENVYKATIKPKETRNYDYFEDDEVQDTDFPLDKLEFPNQFWIYYEHLCKLGLCEKIYNNIHLTKTLAQSEDLAKFQKNKIVVFLLQFGKFGKAFAEICVSEKCKEFIK